MSDTGVLEMTDHGCKVERVSQKYGFASIDDRLRHRYENEDYGLRQLEDYLSRRILRRAMEDARMNPIDGKPANYLELLTSGDDFPRQKARRELRRAGVDVNAVEDDLVSYQTIRKHLNECLDTDTSNEYEPSVSEDRDRIGRLESRVINVVERTIDRLREHDALAIGPPDVHVSIKVCCGACGRSHNVYTLLRSRECACSADDEDSSPTNNAETQTASPTID